MASCSLLASAIYDGLFSVVLLACGLFRPCGQLWFLSYRFLVIMNDTVSRALVVIFTAVYRNSLIDSSFNIGEISNSMLPLQNEPLFPLHDIWTSPISSKVNFCKGSEDIKVLEQPDCLIFLGAQTLRDRH